MKTSLIHSSYDKQTGTSVVGLGSKYGIFWGKSTLLDEDKNFESELRGCTYAEMKAYIKVKKAALKEERAILKGMNNLYKSIMNYKDKDIVTVHYMNKQINIQSKKVAQLEEDIKNLEIGLTNVIGKNDAVLKKIQKKYNSKADE
jgi:hypothetical protein